mmetsp:Transcript_1989/g.7605  ORF Transcript_1989/g.7605 Transcript_1989/m.7605 type:complete len:377 (-) Transcript_1989:1475-2605(-)
MPQLVEAARLPAQTLLLAVHLLCFRVGASELIPERLDLVEVVVDEPKVAVFLELVHADREAFEVLEELVALLLELALKRLPLAPEVHLPVADDLVDVVHPARRVVDFLEVDRAQHGPAQPVLALEQEPQPGLDAHEVREQDAQARRSELLDVRLEVHQLELARRLLDHVIHDGLEVLDELLVFEQQIAQHCLQQNLYRFRGLQAEGLVDLGAVDRDHLQADLVGAFLADGGLRGAELVDLRHVVLTGQRQVFRQLPDPGLLVEKMLVLVIQLQGPLDIPEVEAYHARYEFLSHLNMALVQRHLPKMLPFKIGELLQLHVWPLQATKGHDKVPEDPQQSFLNLNQRGRESDVTELCSQTHSEKCICAVVVVAQSQHL